MVLDVKRIISVPGSRSDFSFEEDLSDVDFGGAYPAAHPVSVVGQVRNSAEMLHLQMKLDTVLSVRCDRCLAPLELPFAREFSCMLAETLEDEDNDEIRLLENDTVDLGELAREVLILNMPTRFLCREDCKGLCSGCGVDLNKEPCRCRKETDPRLQVLAKLLH